MSKILDCLNDLKARIQTIDGLENKTFIAYDPQDLQRQLLTGPSPAVGVTYEGMRSTPEQGSMRQGMATVASFGLYLRMDLPTIAPSINQKAAAVVLLDSIRKVIIQATAPSGHQWRFVAEVLAEAAKDKALWVQRWDTPVIVQR